MVTRIGIKIPPSWYQVLKMLWCSFFNDIKFHLIIKHSDIIIMSAGTCT